MFINTPNNFASMWEELTFEYSTSSQTDLLFEIIDDVSGETLGVKKFYSTTSAKINIAPLLFEKMLPEASYVTTSGMLLPEVGFPRIRAQVGSDTTSGIYFTYAKEQLEAPEILSSMPLQRALYKGECDQVAVVAEEGTTLSYIISAEPIDESKLALFKSVISSISGGARVFYLNADHYNDTYKSLTFGAYQDGELIGEVNYSLSDQSQAGYRLAWISSRGSIEHYTFPTLTEESYLSSGTTEKTLRSAYGTAQEVEALSEIISSPTVWSVSGSSYTPIEVETSEISIRKEGTLMIANIKIVENG